MNDWLDKAETGYKVEVVSRPLESVGFVRQSQRYVVEHSLAWLGRSRRHGRDYERFTESSESMLKTNSIHNIINIFILYHFKQPPLKYREVPEKWSRRCWRGCGARE